MPPSLGQNRDDYGVGRGNFARRAAEERVSATGASHASAKKTHLELASRYEVLALPIARREYALGLGFETADWLSLGVERPALATTPDQPRQSLQAGR
jgi:hypothetical protein